MVMHRTQDYVQLAPVESRQLYHRAFRAAHTPLYDRPDARSQFSMCCANLAEFRMYWDPPTGKLIARSVICARAFKVPPSVIAIGVYCAPFDPEDFLNDLDSSITAYERIASRHAAAV